MYALLSVHVRACCTATDDNSVVIRCLYRLLIVLAKYRKLQIKYTHQIEETAVDVCLQCSALLSFALALLSRFKWPSVQQATSREQRRRMRRPQKRQKGGEREGQSGREEEKQKEE